MNKTEKYYYFICKEYKLIRHSEKCIISFSSTVSTFEISDSSLFVGTYDGVLFDFEKESYSCIRKIVTSIAIKHLSILDNYLVLCLEDDFTQIVDLSVNKYVNLTGHRSFTNCALSLKSTLLLGSYDGFISITNLNKIKNWRKF